MNVSKKTLLMREVISLKYASCAFRSALPKAGDLSHVDGNLNAIIALHASQNAFAAFNTIALLVRNMQDEVGGAKAKDKNPEVGRIAKSITSQEQVRIMTEKKLPAQYQEKVNLRDILNRFAHASEDQHDFRIDDEGHFMLIASSKRIVSVIEFEVDTFCHVCGSLAE